MKRRLLSIVLTMAMLLSLVPTAAFAVESAEELNYVSIGDSMTNGYGFDGYYQGENGYIDALGGHYDFMGDKGVYGKGSYALQFEDYLTGLGYDVNHTKLAPSGLLADNLLYLLGGTEEDFDDGWNGYLDYVANGATYENGKKVATEELREYFQKGITEADIITMCIGNASFGAYLIQMITDAMGIMGADPVINPNLTLDNGLRLLKNEADKEVIKKIYNSMMEDVSIDSGKLPADIDLEVMKNIVAYTAATFIFSYEAVIDRMLELNTQDDLEIMLIGLMNTTYGMVITGEDEETGEPFEFAVGDMMDNVMGMLNEYIAALPAARQAMGKWQDAKFYYAAQPNPKFIVQAFDDLYAADWQDIDCGLAECTGCNDEDENTVCSTGKGRLSGTIVRGRNLQAYNGMLRGSIGSALGFALPAVTLDDVNNYVVDNDYNSDMPWMAEYFTLSAEEQAQYTGANYVGIAPAGYEAAVEYDVNKQISVAVYLAIEKAVVDNVDTMELTMGGLTGISNNPIEALGPMPEELANSPTPIEIYNALAGWFNASDDGRAMCKVYALFKVGNGMSVHPTPAGHDNIFASVIAAYEGGYTVDKELDAILARYPDFPVAMDIYTFLRGNDYLTSSQTLVFLDLAYGYYKEDGLSNVEKMALGQYLYELLIHSEELTDEEKADVIGGIYVILGDAGYLADYEEDLAVVEALYAFLAANEYIDATQSVAIVDEIYMALTNDGELSDAEKTAFVQFVYETLLYNEKLTDADKANLIGGVYAILKDAGYLADYAEDLAVVEELYTFLDSNECITDAQSVAIVDYLYKALTNDGQLDDAEKAAFVDYIYSRFIGQKSELTDAKKALVIGGVYEILGKYGYLKAYEEKLDVVEELYIFLDANDSITDEQSVAIVDYLYDAVRDGELSDKEQTAFVKYLYKTLLRDADLDDVQKANIIGGVYTILGEKGYLAGYEKETATVEALYAFLDNNKYISAKQSVAIVDCVYNALTNDGEISEKELKTIALYIYNLLTGTKEAVPVAAAEGSSSSGSSMSDADKFAIISGVYEILDAAGYLTAYAADLTPIVDIYNNVALYDVKAAVAIFETVFYGILENDSISDEIKNDIIDKVYSAVMKSDKIPAEAKMAIVEEVADLLKSGYGVDLEVIEALRDALKAEGYLEDDAAVEIINVIYDFVMDGDLTEREKAQLADKIHNLLLGRDDLSAAEKAEMVMIVYTVLDEYGYVDSAIAAAMAYAFKLAMENGYISGAANGLAIAQNAIGTAKDFIDANVPAEYAAIKALLIEELDNTADTLAKMEAVLNGEAGVETLVALVEDLQKHLDTLSDLADAAGIAIDPYLEQIADAAADINAVVEDIIDEAYAIISVVETFPDAYAAWVESVGAAVDTVSPELGALVRKYLNDNAADAVAILTTYGQQAIDKLVAEAVAAYGDIAGVAMNLAYVLSVYGEEIYEAVKDNAEVVRLVEAIKAQLAKAAELAEWIDEHPFEGAYNATVADKQAALDKLYAELAIHYAELSKVLESVIAEVDPIAAAALMDALDAMVEMLAIACDSAEGYLGWLADHAAAMGAALLDALLENTCEFLSAACPIVDQMIWALIAKIEAAIPGIIDYLIDALLAFLPIADQWMYDWLYNHPHEVIAFFTEYGDELAALTMEYGQYPVAILAYIAYTYGPEVVEFVIENPCEALDLFVKWYEKYGYRIWPMIDVYLEALGVYDAIEDQLNTVNSQVAALLAMLEEQLADLLVLMNAQIEDLLGDAEGYILAQIAALQEALKDAEGALRDAILAEIAALEETLKQMVIENITDRYIIGENSYYVALGDAGAYGPAADKLAAAMGMTDKYANLTTINADAAAVLAALNAAEIAKADLITLGFSANAFTAAAAADLLAAAGFGGTVSEKNWAALTGEYGAEAIAIALSELTDYVAEQVGDASIAALLTMVVESYAYSYINHLVNYILVSEAIHDVNEEALLVLVGMHNPMDGVVIDLAGETLDLGAYIDYLVTLTNVYSFAYALYADETIYVHAPDVELGYNGSVMDVNSFITELMNVLYGVNDKCVFIPTDIGYQYIQEQIYKALNYPKAGVEDDKEDEACKHAFSGDPDDISWNWFETNKGWDCSAYYLCAKCGEKMDLDCKVNAEVTQPTDEKPGKVVYTATVVIDGVEYTSTKTVSLPFVPNTGDTVMVGLYVTMALLAAAAGVVVLKKKKAA